VTLTAPRLAVRERHEPCASIVVVAGQLDLATVPRLRAALDRAVRRRDPVVTVDLTGLEFIDSVGLSALLNAARRLTRAGGRLRVVCPPGQVRRTIDHARLTSTLGVAPVP
jgi:anti-sigma B factor antagonist